MNEDEKRNREAAQFLDNLTAFLLDDRSKEEILESLQAQGVDTEERLREFSQILSEHAPTWRERASRARRLAKVEFQHEQVKVRRNRNEVMREIQALVESMRAQGFPLEAGAFHRKFKEATDQDLESLLEDLRIQRDLALRKERDANLDD